MDQRYYDSDYPPTNRDRSHSPKRGMGWCVGCDTKIVEDGKKCPHCGCLNGDKKRIKK